MKRGQRGVTLIELMIVVVIVGILGSIAIPAYRQYILRANRSSGKILLMQVAQDLERCYTSSTPYAYNSATCTAAVPLPMTAPDGTYVVNFTAAATATSYSLTATPQGAQTADTKCKNFTLTQAGVQGISGTSTVAECWRK